MLAVGGIAAVYAPLEIHCFSLFSEGGRFHYEGFGFGSFMVGNIAAQILGYYVIAAALLPLGYAHVRRRRWARWAVLSLTRAWIVCGAPLAAVVVFTLLSAKDPGPAAAAAAIAAGAFSYVVMPWAVLRLYGSEPVRRVFEEHEPVAPPIEARPKSVVAVAFLCCLYALLLHVPIFFRGVVPVGWRWLSGLPGVLVLDGLILSLLAVAWGLWTGRAWAWWAGIAWFAAATVSAVAAPIATGYDRMLAMMSFPPAEMEFLGQLPFRGIHFAIFIGGPVAGAGVMLWTCRRHFRRGESGRNPAIGG